MSDAPVATADVCARTSVRIACRYIMRLTLLACLLVFAWIAWAARALPQALNPVDVGPGRLPTLAAILGMACCAALFVRAGRAAESVQWIEVHRWRCVAAGALVIVIYVLALPHVSFYPASLVAVVLLMAIGGEKRPLMLGSGAVGFCVFVYLGFERLLGVAFP